MTKKWRANGKIPASRLRVEWKPQDLWVGVFWKWDFGHTFHDRLDVWVCLLPCLPIHFTHWRTARELRP